MPSIPHYTVISAYFATVSSRFRKMRTQSTVHSPQAARTPMPQRGGRHSNWWHRHLLVHRRSFIVHRLQYRRGRPSPSSTDHREGQDRFQYEQTRRAARYARRASRSVVVSLSLSRRSRIWVRKKQWLVVSNSWFVKTCHYTRMGCNRISQRAASHSCPFWQPSCTFRRSAPDGPKRLPGSAPTHTAAGRVFLTIFWRQADVIKKAPDYSDAENMTLFKRPRLPWSLVVPV